LWGDTACVVGGVARWVLECVGRGVLGGGAVVLGGVLLAGIVDVLADGALLARWACCSPCSRRPAGRRPM
jgi:hypothetical protein